MLTDLLGVIDIGKTHSRLFLVARESGTVVFEAQRANLPCEGAMLRELDCAGIERWLIETLAGVPYRSRIRTLVPVAHGAAAILIDGRGETVAAPDYEDSRFEAVAEAYRPLRDAFAFTFSPFLPLGLNLGRQLYFFESRCPERY